MSNEKTNSSQMKMINKWLNKLFGINLIKSVDLDGLRYEIQFLRDKINNLYLGYDSRVEFHQRDAEYRVYLIRDFYYIPIAKFHFTPNDADSKKYAKVCAEDLADALRDAQQYEPIK